MGSRIGSYFAKPRTGNHHGSGTDELVGERRETCDVFGVRNGEIIGIENNQLGIGRIAKPHLQGLGEVGHYRDVIRGYLPGTAYLHKRQRVAEFAWLDRSRRAVARTAA